MTNAECVRSDLHGYGGVVRFALLAVLLALALAPSAAAGPIVDRAAAALAANPVYVDPQAERALSPGESARLRNEIATRGHGPIYIAVLPAAAVNEAGGDAVGVVDLLRKQLGSRGVYAVVAGNHFRAESTDLGPGKAGKLATAAFKAKHNQGVGPTLLNFVDRVGDARTGGSGDNKRGLLSRVGLFPILLVAGIGFFLFRSSKRRRTQGADAAAVKEAARQDLVALADDVQGLEQRVEANPAAKRDYDAALEQYSRASSAFDRSRSPEQLAPVAKALEEGRYLMASAESRLEGSEPPERRPACFFDPRHGPSVREVEWSPGGGAARSVPACAACALRVEEGGEPESRQVLAGGRMTPYWAAGPAYGGYFGGFFPGLFLGELLGGFGGFGGGWDTGGDGGGGSAGGDFGSGMGDFGGGDFGGGGDGGGGDF
jgi:hypothetical protein